MYLLTCGRDPNTPNWLWLPLSWTLPFVWLCVKRPPRVVSMGGGVPRLHCLNSTPLLTTTCDYYTSSRTSTCKTL